MSSYYIYKHFHKIKKYLNSGKLAGLDKMDRFKDRQIIGLTEIITIIGSKTTKKAVARIDTGATKSSIDKDLAAELGLGPTLRTTMIRSANGRSQRNLVKATIEIGNSKIDTEFSVADRTHMRFRVLLGQNILNEGFIIDPTINHEKKI